MQSILRASSIVGVSTAEATGEGDVGGAKICAIINYNFVVMHKLHVHS